MILLDHLGKQNVYDDTGPTALDGLINTLEECSDMVPETFREKARRAIEAAGK